MQYCTPGTAGLFALMYSSDAVGKVTRETLGNVLEVSRRNNVECDVTGILLFRHGRFYQYLEGPEEHVRDLYRSISADPRHTNLKVLLEADVQERRFSEWTMGYEPLRETTTRIPAGFRSTFTDIEDTRQPNNVLRAIVELTHWYRSRAARTSRKVDQE